MAKNAQVKVVKAFPLKCGFKSEAGAFPGQILKMNLMGFIADIGAVQPRAGDRFEVTFDLPVLGHSVATVGVVVKTYNQLGGVSAPPGVASSNLACMVEMHFRGLNDVDKSKISSYLAQASGSPRR